LKQAAGVTSLCLLSLAIVLFLKPANT